MHRSTPIHDHESRVHNIPQNSAMGYHLSDLLIALVILLTLFLNTDTGTAATTRAYTSHHPRNNNGFVRDLITPDTASYCLSWRLAVEANNVKAWRTAPTECWLHIKDYMVGGQYNKDLNFIMQQVYVYVDGIALSSDDGFDAWILDIDDTCLSNIVYYSGRRFGCDPYDPEGFRSWASKGWCPAIPAVLGLYKKLVGSGFQVILLTGRDEETLGQATMDNLHQQGFAGYHRLIMRNRSYKGVSSIIYKSEIRKHLVEEGYRIWGNVGDQWSDLHGGCPGNMTFKLPNPMYYVP